MKFSIIEYESTYLIEDITKTISIRSSIYIYTHFSVNVLISIAESFVKNITLSTVLWNCICLF